MVRQVLVNWVVPRGSSNALSVFHFDEGVAVADQRSALNDFLTALESRFGNGVGWTIATTGRELDDATGALTGTWADGTVWTGGGGTGDDDQVPGAAMALVRWSTGHIVNGRILAGRQFLPGFIANSGITGDLDSFTVADITTAGQALCNAGIGFGVWHRPRLNAGGLFWIAETASAWSEFAVLRRRRG